MSKFISMRLIRLHESVWFNTTVTYIVELTE